MPMVVFFFTLVTGSRRSLSLKLSDTRVYAPQIRARLGTTAHFCEALLFLVVLIAVGQLAEHAHGRRHLLLEGLDWLNQAIIWP